MFSSYVSSETLIAGRCVLRCRPECSSETGLPLGKVEQARGCSLDFPGTFLLHLPSKPCEYSCALLHCTVCCHKHRPQKERQKRLLMNVKKNNSFQIT